MVSVGKRSRRTSALAGCMCAFTAFQAAPAEAACKTYRHRAKAESLLGTDLAYLNISIRVCHNGRRITKAETLDITPSTTKNALGSVEFLGVSPEPIAEYRAWHGRSRGSYYVKAGGSFKQNLVAWDGKAWYMWASMRITGDGKVTKKRQNG